LWGCCRGVSICAGKIRPSGGMAGPCNCDANRQGASADMPPDRQLLETIFADSFGVLSLAWALRERPRGLAAFAGNGLQGAGSSPSRAWPASLVHTVPPIDRCSAFLAPVPGAAPSGRNFKTNDTSLTTDGPTTCRSSTSKPPQSGTATHARGWSTAPNSLTRSFRAAIPRISSAVAAETIQTPRRCERAGDRTKALASSSDLSRTDAAGTRQSSRNGRPPAKLQRL
jgi:hypothetical protein